MGDALSAFNFHGYFFDHVKLLVREVEKKDNNLASAQTSLSSTKESLSNAQGYLENLRLEYISLAQQLDIVTGVDLVLIFDSFEGESTAKLDS